MNFAAYVLELVSLGGSAKADRETHARFSAFLEDNHVGGIERGKVIGEAKAMADGYLEVTRLLAFEKGQTK